MWNGVIERAEQVCDLFILATRGLERARAAGATRQVIANDPLLDVRQLSTQQPFELHFVKVHRPHPPARGETRPWP